jgi:hypothetical protein
MQHAAYVAHLVFSCVLCSLKSGVFEMYFQYTEPHSLVACNVSHPSVVWPQPTWQDVVMCHTVVQQTSFCISHLGVLLNTPKLCRPKLLAATRAEH